MPGARARLLGAGISLAALGAAALWVGRTPAPQPRAGEQAVAARSGRRPAGPPPQDSAPREARIPVAELPAGPPGSTHASVAERADDPAALEAYFAAVPSSYAARSSRKPGPDAELERAVAEHVSSERPSTALAALKAARVPLMTERPSESVVHALVELASPGKPAARRHAALEALNLLRPDRRGEAVLLAFEQALDSGEAHLVSLGLLALSQSRRSVDAALETTRTRLAARVVTLLEHGDPGVRGHALLVLAELTALVRPDVRYRAAARAWSDHDGYVRARAADLFGRSREPAAIHTLMGGVRDLAPARYELRGFTLLDGGPGVLVHELPGRKRVAEAALFALLALSELVPGASELVLTLPGRPAPDARVLENAGIAAAWYHSTRALIPARVE